MSLEYPPFVWAKDIRVEKSGDALQVTGTAVISQQDVETTRDPFHSYMRAVSRYGLDKRQGKNSFHIQFANADTEGKLIQFIQRFGPLVVSSLTSLEQKVEPDSFDFERTETDLIARQDWAELANEHRAYRAALRLIAELERKKQSDISVMRACILEISEGVTNWPNQWLRERRLRRNGVFSPQPCWLFNEDNLRVFRSYGYAAASNTPTDRLEGLVGWPPSDAVELSHHVITDLVNAYPPVVHVWGQTPVEAPDWDLTFGIRPLLYYILRRQYLQTSGIAVCRNVECRAVFEIERAGQEFCSDVCSRRQRQREYWKTTGKRRRKSRLKHQPNKRKSI
jgi:hypothetical protein